MLVDLHAAFAMFSLCYAQQSNYLQCTIFPSLSILQHYTKFDVYTIVMEKLLKSLSFGTIVGHLARSQVTFPISFKVLGLPLVVQHVSPAFLRC
jgi:hypothetical protein